MRKSTTALLLSSILYAGAVPASALFAQDSQKQSGPMMGHGMMGDKNTKGEGGMMGMMKQGSEMTDHCSNMMNDNRPNDQWRHNAPSAPEKKG